MIYLLLSILTSSSIFIIFKLFDKYNIDRLQAIIFNYGIACTCGIIAYQKTINISELPQYNWFYFTIGLGIIFISVFNIMAITAQRNGLSVVAVAGKMSVVIPIIFGLLLYNETIGWLKALGIILALISIYLVTVNPEGIKKGASLLFPLLVFIGSGFIDTSLKFLQTNYVQENEVALFSASIFGAAFIIGILVLFFQIIKKTFVFKFKNLVGGVSLGIINYFSIYFLIKAIGYKSLESSTVFTINNVSILLTTAILGVILFKEQLNNKNKLGILLASIGIVLVSVSGKF